MELIEAGWFPFPFQAAFSVASDIDSASVARFRAIHALFCGSGVIRPGSAEWKTLGLKRESRWYESELGGVAGLRLPIADSFFLIGDATTFGMYRERAGGHGFDPDQQDGQACDGLIKEWIRAGEIDCFHAFLHYTRVQTEPLLKEFYAWCERQSVSKPLVWANHSAGSTPSGLCPDALQPSRTRRLLGLAARQVVGPLFGRRRHPLRQAFVRYSGDSPGSRYYINDLLAENGLRYVWLNYGDLHLNQICLPTTECQGRRSILDIVQLDDGIRYYRFHRCYGWPRRARGEGMYLADSNHGHDTSQLITEENLRQLTENRGTCILETHWTHSWSMPISDETIARFRLLRNWRDAGRIWIAPTSRLLEWTRRRTFLDISCTQSQNALLVEINGVDDPLFGRQQLKHRELHRFCFRLLQPQDAVRCAVHGRLLEEPEVQRAGDWIWLNTDPGAERVPEDALAVAANR